MVTALYRRYRPETFADVIGQEHVTGPLQQALRAGRVGHAYLFSGPRGCGKTTSARILARCLNCAQGPTPEPCGTCESCVALTRGGPGSIDVIEIDAASHGGVEDARELREKAAYGPARSRYKVYIIDEAHMVTPQGFNALLKIVEEPPEHVKFVFATTEPEKVIGTIRSRTHHYPFRLVPPARLQTYLEELCELEGVAVEPGVLSFVVRAGGGSVRDCLSVLDQLIAGAGEEGLTYGGAAALLGFTEGELLDATVTALAAGDGAAVFRQIDRITETGHDPRRFVEDLLERLRDLIVVSAVGADDVGAALIRGAPQDLLERMRQQASSFGPGELSYAADIVNAGLTEMTGATSPRLQLELICARLLLPSAAGAHGLVARVDRIERRLDVAGPAEHSDAPAAVRALTSPAIPAPAAPAPPAAAPPGTPDRESAPRRDSRAEVPADAVRADSATRAAARGGGSVPAGVPPAPVRARLDTDAMRRSWPDVLAKIFIIRRVTWTFLSEHAQVLDFDGERLLLGITTRGLAHTFRQGHHHEVVRQALVEALGVDARIEGIPATDATPTEGDPRPGSPVVGSGGADPAGAGRVGGARPRLAGPDVPGPARAGGEAVTDGDAATDGDAIPHDAATDGEADDAVPGREAFRRVREARRAGGGRAGPGEGRPGYPGGEDDAASVDDEDVEALGSVGQPVIAAVLGGTVIDETRD